MIPVLLLAGCLESLLEAPYILTAGLGAVHDLTPTPDGNLFAATSEGIVHLSGDGQATLQDPLRADAITTHTVLYALVGDELHWAALPLGSAPWQTQPAPPGTRDLQAWCSEPVVVLATDNGLMLWTPADGSIAPMGWGGAAEKVALTRHDTCDSLLTAHQGTVQLRSASGSRVLAQDLGPVHAVASSFDGSVWAAHQEAPVLSVLGAAGPETRARHLGDVHALQFGMGGLWAVENAYLASSAGRVDYVQVVHPP